MKKIATIHRKLLATIVSLRRLFFPKPPIFQTSQKDMIWGKAVIDECRIPKIIWTFWSGPQSACVDACRQALKACCSDFKIILLSEKNLQEYLPSLAKTPSDLPVQLSSDLIRLSILEAYGGIWMDSSVITTCNLDWAINSASNTKSEMVCYYNESNNIYRKDDTRPIIENGFIASIKNSKFIADWLTNFRRCIYSESWQEYYLKHKNKDALFKNFINPKINEISYFSCYLSAQETMLSSNDYKLLLMNSEHDYYLYYYKTKWPLNRINFCSWILMSDEPDHVPRLIKLPRRLREMADTFIKCRFFTRTSILGKYLY